MNSAELKIRNVLKLYDNSSDELATEQFEVKLPTECFAICVTLFLIVANDNDSSRCGKTSKNINIMLSDQAVRAQTCS
ncbi:Protein of unknown function [Cotesia congregata]|uniref:Uncharacterized protein n=1 Tax=Cotesia congregata TaxID=51543 RepID=A0A8J2MKT8_COTCN|nr:Protein of unknown function [Cotesia congregata]